MEVKNLFNAKIAFFQGDVATKEDVIAMLVSKLAQEKMLKDEKLFKKAIIKREDEISTGMGDGIAIPHAINPTVQTPAIAFLSLKKAIDWNSLDGQPVDLIFMIATNDEKGTAHLAALADLAKFLTKPEFSEKLRQATSFKELQAAFKIVESKSKAEHVVNSETNSSYDVVGVTACPTGIAHTYLAEEKLKEYAAKLNMTVKIETQGRRGTENKLTAADIDKAKVIILAHDKNIQGMARFANKKVIDTSTKDAIYHGQDLINNFGKDDKTMVYQASSAGADEVENDFAFKNFKQVKGNLLAGVSRMLPFVVAGGIVLGIAFLIDFIAGNGKAGGAFGTVNPAAGWFAAIGKTSMMMMVPILAAYISYTIVGPQGLMPGMVAGLFADGTGGFVYATNPNPDKWEGLWSRLFAYFNGRELQSDIPMTSGFIGALFGGYLAALIVFGLTLSFKRFAKPFQGVRDIVLIPVLSLLAIALVMFGINIPLGYTMFGIQSGLEWLAKKDLLLLVGLIIGFMMCVDMGGPVNKIAYTLGTLAVAGKLGSDPFITVIMASSMAAGMVPPLGIAVCTILFKKVWTVKERDAAKANWLMGAFFISEGAIPFMVTDPKRVAFSGMASGAITGLLVASFKITLSASHGGIAVFPLLQSGLLGTDKLNSGLSIGLGISLFTVAIIAGSLTMALLLGIWKKIDIKKGKLIINN